jgi:hypothetical protein
MATIFTAAEIMMALGDPIQGDGEEEGVSAQQLESGQVIASWTPIARVIPG